MRAIRTNLTERLREGRQLARSKHKEGETAKLGNLRAGNSGIMSAEGEVAGSCHRTAHLRQLGIEVEEPDDSKLIMFQMGTANEDVVYADLLHTAGPGEIILREEEISIEWFTANGTKVTGRPDMAVCRLLPESDTHPASVRRTSAGLAVEPVYGAEIKSIASVWTTREVLSESQPKLPHLIQSAHYSWKLGVPFRLLYKQYANQAVPSWAGKMFPRQGEPGSEHISYNEKGDIKAILPFEIAYELEFTKAGYLRYRRESVVGGPELPWTKSLVSTGDIARYYEFISTMAETGDLGPRPLTLDAVGKEKNYSNCGYCPLNATCDKYEDKGYKTWLTAVKKELRTTFGGKKG